MSTAPTVSQAFADPWPERPSTAAAPGYPAPPEPADPGRRARRRRLLVRLLWVWLAFWLLMFLLGAQEHFWTGGRRLLPPLIDYGTAALVATLLAAWKIGRDAPLDRWLDRPWQWFLRWSAWLPLELPGYLAAIYLMRTALWALVGQPLRHGRWDEVVRYEAGKFLLFYALFAGIHFGLKSYYAWLAGWRPDGKGLTTADLRPDGDGQWR